MPFLPPMTGNGLYSFIAIKMVMTGGWSIILPTHGDSGMTCHWLTSLAGDARRQRTLGRQKTPDLGSIGSIGTTKATCTIWGLVGTWSDRFPLLSMCHVSCFMSWKFYVETASCVLLLDFRSVPWQVSISAGAFLWHLNHLTYLTLNKGAIRSALWFESWSCNFLNPSTWQSAVLGLFRPVSWRCWAHVSCFPWW